MSRIATAPATAEKALLKAARALPEASRVMLEYLALALLPVPIRELFVAYETCCARLGIFPLEQSPDQVLADLVRAGLVQLKEPGPVCHPGIREDVAVGAMPGEHARIIARVAAPKPDTRRHRRVPTYGEGLRAVRLALYGAARGANTLQDLAAVFQAHPGVLPEIGRGFLDPKSLSAFDPNVAFYLANRTLERACFEAWDAPAVRKWMDKLGTRIQSASEEVYPGVHQMTLLLRADAAELERLSTEGTELIRMFASAASGKPFEPWTKPGLPRLQWPFQSTLFAGCLLASGQIAKLEELATLEGAEPTTFERTLVWLMAQVAKHPHVDARMFVQEFGWTSTWCPAWQVFTAVGLSWLGLKVELKNLVEPLTLALARYEKSGHQLMASVARELLRRIRKEEPLPCPLLDFVRPTPQSERRLLELAAWANKQRDRQRGIKVGDERLIWMVERRGNTIQVEPKVQKIKKNGEWSSGRALRLVHTAQNTPAFADEHDRRVLRSAIAAYASYSPMREDETALLELVGHPRVLWEEKGIARPVAVERGRTRLRLKKKGGELLLRLEPKPGKRAAVQAVFETDRLTVFSLTPEQKELSAILGPDWFTVSDEREEEIREIASVAASLDLVLDSDLRLGSEDVTVAADPTLRLRLAPDNEGLVGQLLVRPFGRWGPTFEPGKGGEAVSADLNGVSHHALRDLKAEKTAVKAARAKLPALAPSFRLETLVQSLDFLESLKEQLAEVVVEWPEGETLQLMPSRGSSQLSVAVTQERDWFSMDGSLSVSDDEVLSLQQLLQLNEERDGGRFLSLGEGRYLALTQELRSRLDQLALLTEKGTKGRLKVQPLVATVAFPDLLPKDGALSEQRRRLEQSSQLRPQLPEDLRAELRAYQEDGFGWMLRLAHWNAGACLADDMGLGKTVQTLAVLLERSSEGPALVVAPTSVCPNWSEEVTRFAPGLTVRSLADSGRTAALVNLGPGDIVLCSYGILVNEIDRLKEISWATVVLDEAQYVKNAATRRFKAAISLEAGFRLATTGTPIENHLEELWSLFAFLNPGLLGTRSSFVARFVRPIAAGDDDVKATLRRLVHPFILRRNKADVLRELPAKTEITHTVQLSPKEMALYESLRREAVDTVARSDGKIFSVLPALMKLRRACCHPSMVLPGSTMPSSKLEAFSELVDELRAGDHRALVFSQFVDHLAIVRAHLETRGISYRYLDGSTPPKKRREAVDAFQAGDGELFLISLRAGGVGLNLTAADYVIHLDSWWNPAVEDQASDRAHRMGQTKPVTVYRLVAAGTIEQKIVALHADKRDLAERLLEGTDKAAKLDVNELMALLTQA